MSFMLRGFNPRIAVMSRRPSCERLWDQGDDKNRRKLLKRAEAMLDCSAMNAHRFKCKPDAEAILSEQPCIQKSTSCQQQFI